SWLDVSTEDRISPIITACASGPIASRLWLETADTNDGKALAALIRKLERPLESALLKTRFVRPKQVDAPRLHVFLERASGSSSAGPGRTTPPPGPWVSPGSSFPGKHPAARRGNWRRPGTTSSPGGSGAAVWHRARPPSTSARRRAAAAGHWPIGTCRAQRPTTGPRPAA